MSWCSDGLGVAGVGPPTGEFNADQGDDGARGVALDVGGDAGVFVVVMLLVVITTSSIPAGSSMVKFAVSLSCSADHVHWAPSSKMTLGLMWTHRVVGS